MELKKICKKCGEEFPNHFYDEEGKRHNLQKRKYCLKCSPFGGRNTRKLEIKSINENWSRM